MCTYNSVVMEMLKGRFQEIRNSVRLLSEAFGVNCIFIWLFTVTTTLPIQISEVPGDDYTLRNSTWSSVPTIVFVCCLLKLYAGTARSGNSAHYPHKTIINSWLDLFDYVLIEALGMTVLVTCLVRQRHWFKFVRNLLNFHKRLGRVRSATIRNTTLIASLTIYVVEITVAVYLVKNPQVFVADTVSWLAIQLSYTLGFVAQSQVLLALFALRNCFLKFNETLKHFHGYQRKELFLNAKTSGIPGVSGLTRTSRYSQVKASNVRYLSSLHADLQDAGKYLNAVYSPISLSFVLVVFSQVITLSFILVVNVLYSKVPKSDIFGSLLCLVLLYISKLVIALLCCSMTCSEANKTATAVDKLYNVSVDAKEKYELLLFSRELLGNKMVIYACRLFPMDVSLLYKILCAVATYLVILTKFQVK